MREGVSFTQETTLSGQRPARIARQAKDAGYYVRLYYVGISSEAEALKRIANRVAKGGHDIPREDVHRRYGRAPCGSGRRSPLLRRGGLLRQ